MTEVVIEKLKKVFPPKTVAVDEIDLTFNDKEFTILLGPSGCGKTTTLRMIAGLEKPTSGNIYFDGELVNDLTPKDRDVAMVFQSYALYPHMKVYENLAFPLKMRGLSRDEIDKRVKETAEMLRITHLLDKEPRMLSGGEAQRTALGRAIIRNPRVFLLDEPLSNLDAKLRVHMRVELKRLQRQLGVTTIYVTHDQEEAITLADRIAVMRNGKIMQVANPYELYHHPENMFVAGFIGSPAMNMIECTLIEKKGEPYLIGEEFELRIPSDMAGLIKDSSVENLVLGIRPEDISVDTGESQGPFTFTAEIYELEPSATQTIVNFTLGGKVFKAIAPPEYNARMGERVKFYINIKKIHVFNKKTEEAIF